MTSSKKFLPLSILAAVLLFCPVAKANETASNQSAATSTAGNQATQSRFGMFHQFSYRNATLQDYEALGMREIPIMTSWFFFPNSIPTETITPEVKAHILYMTRNYMQDNKLYVLDIEHWPTGSNVSQEVRKASVEKYIQVIDLIKSVRPSVKLGYYSMFPSREYWSVYKNCSFNPQCAEMDRQRRLATADLRPAMQKVDFLFPSLYTFYPDEQGWLNYAEANLQEAVKLQNASGRNIPIIVYLWPAYHPSSAPPGFRPLIPGPYWKKQLDYIYTWKEVSGILIWDRAYHMFDFNIVKTEPWFNVTLDFIKNLKPTIRPLSQIKGTGSSVVAKPRTPQTTISATKK